MCTAVDVASDDNEDEDDGEELDVASDFEDDEGLKSGRPGTCPVRRHSAEEAAGLDPRCPSL